MNPDMKIPQLCKIRIKADWEKSEAMKTINLVNEALLDQITNQFDEGSNTVEVEGFKITTIAKLNRKLDAEAWEKVKDKVPEKYRDVVTYKPTINLKRLRMVEEMLPEVFATIAEALTTSPATTAVKVVEVD